MASKARESNTKTITRWAIHHLKTEQLGYLCSTKEEAEEKLEELKKTMSPRHQAKYQVVEVQVSWVEP